MSDTDLHELRDQIDRAFRWWLDNLGLRHWEWQIKYHFSGYKPETPELGDYICPMECVCRWEYMQFHVKVYLPNIADALTTPERRQYEIDRMVVHELCHALLCELRAEIVSLSQARFDRHIEHEERVASMLTNAFLWVRQFANEPHDDQAADWLATGISTDVTDEPEDAKDDAE